MTYQEKESIVNIFSGLLITGLFALNVWQRHAGGVLDLTQDYSAWGKLFLWFIGISIVARIIIYIIFHILNAIATRETNIPVSDERDKLIKLKSLRNGYYVFTSAFVLSVIGLAIGMPVYGMFIAFVAGGLLSEIVENGSQIYFNRKGINND